jgi:hypothetical protein
MFQFFIKLLFKILFSNLNIYGPEMHVCPSFKIAIRHFLYFILVSCLAYSLTLKMEVTSSSEVSAECQRTTQHYTRITED